MKKDILLISMPWARIWLPSLQITTLQRFLARHAITSDVASLYIRFADMLGYNKYMDISSVGRCFASEAVFAAHIYSEMKKRAMVLIRGGSDKRLNYSNIFKQTETFLDAVMKDVPFADYRCVGFSIVFTQLFSSLILARRIKQKFPDIKIIFGGDGCRGEKGRSLMQAYPEIDYAISHEGEFPLLHLIEGRSLREIDGLTYRSGSKIIMNPTSKEVVCLDELQPPDYSEYFERLGKTEYLKGVKEFTEKIIIPVETTRGCWWNKCTFCSMNMQCQGYRAKSNKNIVSEVRCQTRLHSIKQVYFVGTNVIPQNTGKLFDALKPLRVHIQMEHHARLNDYNLLRKMKEAGCIFVQIGLESLSKSLLEEKINKGARLIDNIQVLKYLKELNIESGANILMGYPNETREEFDEAISNFRYLYHLEPPNTGNLRLEYESPMYNTPEDFNICKVFMYDHYEYFIPKAVLKKLVLNYYGFKQRVKSNYPKGIFKKELSVWVNKFTNNSCYPLLFYRVKNGCAVITDLRKKYRYNYELDKDASAVYLFCHGARGLCEIQEKFADLTKKWIVDTLNYLVGERLMFREDEHYLSLAIDWQAHRKCLIMDGEKKHKYAGWKRLRGTPPL